MLMGAPIVRRLLLGVFAAASIQQAASAHECRPAFVPEAQIPGLALGEKIDCRRYGGSDGECAFDWEGVKYSVSDGILVRKSVVGDNVKHLSAHPFGVGGREDLFGVVSKISTFKAAPPFFVGSVADGYVLTSDLCLRTRSAEPYELIFRFDQRNVLVEISERLSFP